MHKLILLLTIGMIVLFSCQKKAENGNIVGNEVDTEINGETDKNTIATPVAQEDPDVELMNESKKRLIAFKEDFVFEDDTPINYVIGSPIDDENYPRLAGLYVSNELELPCAYHSVDEGITSWGPDYSFWRGTTGIHYDQESGKWIIGGHGEALEFEIIESNEDSIVIDRGEKTEPRTEKILFKDGFIMIGNQKYNKYSGPTNKYAYLKSIIEYNKSIRSKYSLVSTEDAKRCIGDKPIEILSILKNNDVNSLSGYISRDKGLSINLYNTAEFTFDQCNADNGKYIEEIMRIYTDLNNRYVPNMSKALQFFNNYALCDISVIQGMYPGSIFVELFVNDSTYMCFTFINEENDWKLVQIINNVADFD